MFRIALLDGLVNRRRFKDGIKGLGHSFLIFSLFATDAPILRQGQTKPSQGIVVQPLTTFGLTLAHLLVDPRIPSQSLLQIYLMLLVLFDFLSFFFFFETLSLYFPLPVSLNQTTSVGFLPI